MSNTVSENAKFNVSRSSSGGDDDGKIAIDDYINGAVLPLKPDQDIYDAAKFLSKEKLTGAPVLDEDKSLIGFLSEKDCLKHAFDAKYNSLPPGTVKDYMSRNLIVVQAEADLFEVVELFIRHHFQAYPVLNGDKYVGIIQRASVLKAVQKIKDKVW